MENKYEGVIDVTPIPILSEEQLIDLKRRELQLAKEKLRLKTELPHLYGMPWYAWAWDFFTTTNKEAYLTAGNQLSKSSTQIRKCIDWATDKAKWGTLWPDSPSVPNVMWYLYPNKDVANEEWLTKWQQFMPNGSMKDDPVYGWHDRKKDGKIYAIDFNSGMTVYFKSYSQDLKDLQTGSVYAIFCDEEIPIEILPELKARLNGTDGYFSIVFTATLGQEYFRRIIEEKGDQELQPHAWKRQVSLYDCLKYMDGSPSPWTPEKVERAIARCTTQAEVDRRIHGKFVVIGGRKYEAFTRELNVTKKHVIPSNWLHFYGVDYGSGGENHPSAIVCIAVSPDYKQARVYRALRMDNIVTTAQDVIDELEKILEESGKPASGIAYDKSMKDLHTIASRMGIPLIGADKAVERGVASLNTLFKAGMLKIFEGDAELEKLITEIVTLKTDTSKRGRGAIDDLTDALRYCIMVIPFDWSAMAEIAEREKEIKEGPPPPPKTELDLRREFVFGDARAEMDGAEEEINEWNGYLNEFDS